MVKKRVIFQHGLGRTFGKMTLPDESVALVIDSATHERALKVANKKISKTLQAIKRGKYGRTEEDAA